jgi:hypothetical protein
VFLWRRHRFDRLLRLVRGSGGRFAVSTMTARFEASPVQ